MTAEEIFSQISTHMVKGLMIHSDYADYYYFLNLCGYGETHNKRYIAESLNHRNLQKWYIRHYSKLLPQAKFDYESVIPQSWYKYRRTDVDANTIRKAVKDGLETWVEWERETKKLYQQMYQELMTLDDIFGALYVKELICDVSDELCDAEDFYLKKKALDYSLSDIIAEQ